VKKYGPASGIAFDVTTEEAERFWSKVQKGATCWEWQGSRHAKTGYGTFSLYRVRNGPIHAHRVAYVIHYGRIVAGKVVMHSCDNPGCVNPKHLRLGSQRENTQDMIAKGRKWTPAGRRSPCRECGASRKGVTRTDGLCNTCRNRPQPFFEMLRAERVRHSKMSRLLKVLPPSHEDDLVAFVGERKAGALTRFFGLYGNEAQTMASIAKEYGVTPQRASQLVKAGQDRLLRAYEQQSLPQRAA
jgi:hypothetical protein